MVETMLAGAAGGLAVAGAARARRVWTAGDFDLIAQGFAEDAARFVTRLDLAAGERVLDVACGTGNLALPAARLGAEVTGLDIAPNLLATARSRAVAEGLSVRFDEGDAAALPYPDGAFDTVVTMFGAMFAADPDRTAAELLRVTRPGGRVAMANWVPDGFVGRMLRLHVEQVPSAPGVPSVLLWGDPKVARERLGRGTSGVAAIRRTLVFRYPHAPAGVAELFRAAYGPTVRTFEAIGPDRRADLAGRLTALWNEGAEYDGSVSRVPAEYLEVVARRAA
ncbi:MAG TPA: methyltransferase domain-containing protein [Gemmatimonadales bacterium]|nr:methyltransferase domain-containing protein [Gemmatimonadales bacterium]